MRAPQIWQIMVQSTHQKMTELRPSRWAMGAKKKGPNAMPARAAEFWIQSDAWLVRSVYGGGQTAYDSCTVVLP